MALIESKFTFVNGTICPCKSSLAVHIVVLKVALVYISRCKSVCSIAISMIIDILTFINVTVYPCISSLAIFITISPLTFIYITICPFVSTLPSPFVIYMVTYVVISRRKPKLTMSLLTSGVSLPIPWFLRFFTKDNHWLWSKYKLRDGHTCRNLLQEAF